MEFIRRRASAADLQRVERAADRVASEEYAVGELERTNRPHRRIDQRAFLIQVDPAQRHRDRGSNAPGKDALVHSVLLGELVSSMPRAFYRQ